MAVYDLWLSRNGAPVTGSNYIGHKGRLFYDDSVGNIRLSDGVTPGGIPIPITVATTSTAGSIKPGPGFLVSNTGTLSLNAGPSFYLDETNMFRLRPGTADLIGGIKAGPGLTIDSEGTLFIDTSGLPFTFGDFTGLVGTYTNTTEYALLSSVNADEDIVIASNGDGAVKIVGQFDIYKTNGTVTGSLEDYEPFFRVKEDGQVRILVPLADTTEGGVEIIGSSLGTSLQPGIAGTMLHLTGNPDLPTRVYHDTLGGYSSYVFRRYNGSVTTATQVLANEDIGRINWTASTNAGMGNVSNTQIRVTALENQTTSTQGSKIVFTVTPAGSPATSRVDVATISVADGVSATKFTGPLTGNVTGTASTATNLAAATSILAGTLSVDPPNTGKNASVVGTYTISGLTTSHKVVVMPQAALPDNFNIGGAWASASNTLSINFQTYAGGIDAAAFTLAYFAWI